MAVKKKMFNPNVDNFNPLDIVGWVIGNVEIVEYVGVKPWIRNKMNGEKEVLHKCTYRCRCSCGAEFEKRRELILPRRFKNSWTCGNFEAHNLKARTVNTESRFTEYADRKPALIEELNAKLYCTATCEGCYRSDFLHLCCYECDKKGDCGMACYNDPNKCGSHRPRMNKE